MSENKSVHTGRKAHRHKRSSSKRVLRTITFVLTPFLMLLIIGCLSIILFSGPYAKIKPYAQLIFPPLREQVQNVRTLNKYRDDNAPVIRKDVEDEDTGATHTMIYPYYADYYASLNCEAAGMNDIPVYAGTSVDVLAMGAGWYNASVYIGNVGNVVIAGHNHTDFYNLPKCELGDIVTLETEYCKLTYEITERVIFHEDDYTYIRPTDDDRLTMYTCWNNGKLGMSEYRLAYICTLVEREWKEVD